MSADRTLASKTVATAAYELARGAIAGCGRVDSCDADGREMTDDDDHQD